MPAGRTVSWGGSLGNTNIHKRGEIEATKVAKIDAPSTKMSSLRIPDPKGSGRCTELWPNTPTPERGGV